MKIRQWHYDPVHHQINRNAVERSGKNRAADYKGEFAADYEKYRGSGEGNQKMECEAQPGCGCSTVE